MAITKFMLLFLAPPPNYCLSSPCHNNGICQSLTTTYHCECPETYTGKHCQNSKCVMRREIQGIE